MEPEIMIAIFMALGVVLVVGLIAVPVIEQQQAHAIGATGCHTASSFVTTPSGRFTNHLNTGCFGSGP